MKLSVRIALLLILFFSADLCFPMCRRIEAADGITRQSHSKRSSSARETECGAIADGRSEKGITVVITEGFRSIEEQNELYRQGRSKKEISSPTQKAGNLTTITALRSTSPCKKGWKPDLGYDVRRKPKRHARLA